MLAVLFGTLAADLVRLGVAAIAAKQAEREAVEQLRQLRQRFEAPSAAAGPQARSELPSYPAPSSTAAIGEYACSQGALLRRIDNGWEQVGRSSRQAACRTSSR